MQVFGSDLFTLLTVAIVAFLLGRMTRGSVSVEEKKRNFETAEADTARLSDEARRKVEDLLLKGRTIEAVKVVRQDLGVGLYEAKLTFDYLRPGRG